MAAVGVRAVAFVLAVSVARDPVLMSWSGGKESCMALHALRSAGGHEVAGLLTTVNREDGRVAMHGVAQELIERQAAALGLPLTVVEVPAGASNAVYERTLARALLPMLAGRLQTIAFGDLFLSDIRAYRERSMARLGMTAIFPVWGRDTRMFTGEFLDLGFKAIVVAVDPSRLDPTFADRPIDAGSLPTCGTTSIPAARTASTTATSMMVPASGRRSIWRSGNRI